jgi:folate-dependent phosphoribosylglycinamide formyltransferase PurN
MTPLDIVVLTSNSRGVALAAALHALPEIRSVTVVTTRVVPRQGFGRKLRRMYLHDGAPGVCQALFRRLRGAPDGNPKELAELIGESCHGARHLHFDDLHTPESLAFLRSLAPDLGVVFATYRLRPELLEIPRLGTVNLHLGRAPEYRGSSPGFYEMFDGVPEVGVTVHRISAKLDEGPILLQESFPLDLAPLDDPLEYLKRYQAQVLVPQGIRLMRLAVQRLAQGVAEERAQGGGSRPRPRATYRLKQELRHRVSNRRVLRAQKPGQHPELTFRLPES